MLSSGRANTTGERQMKKQLTKAQFILLITLIRQRDMSEASDAYSDGLLVGHNCHTAVANAIADKGLVTRFEWNGMQSIKINSEGVKCLTTQLNEKLWSYAREIVEVLYEALKDGNAIDESTSLEIEKIVERAIEFHSYESDTLKQYIYNRLMGMFDVAIKNNNFGVVDIMAKAFVKAGYTVETF